MSSSILIILGHPDNDSFCERILNAYAEGAKASGAQVDIVRLSDLNFNVNLKAGYGQHQELEPDLEICRAKIERANHIVIVYPNWWGGPPALLKGFIDRLFLPKWAFTSKEGAFPVGLLKGKSARVISCCSSSRYGRAETSESFGKISHHGSKVAMMAIWPIVVS